MLLGRLSGWLKPEQMRLTALALHYSVGQVANLPPGVGRAAEGPEAGQIGNLPTAPVPPIPARYD